MSPGDRLVVQASARSANAGARGAEGHIKSRERVKAHGEVSTPRFMVDQMPDLSEGDLETGPPFVICAGVAQGARRIH